MAWKRRQISTLSAPKVVKEKEEKDLFDSFEEYYFDEYLKELKETGYIIDYEYHPEKFILSEPVFYMTKRSVKRVANNIIVNEKTLLREHTYQCDFRIVWAEKAENFLYCRFDAFIKEEYPFFATGINGDIVSYVDVKGNFAASTNTSDVRFPVNQKWVFNKYQIFVQKIILFQKHKKGVRYVWTGIFPETFLPKRYLLTDAKKKNRVISFDYILLTDFINKQKIKQCQTEEKK